MGRCRPFPDAVGCRWPRLNGKIDNILPNFSLLDSNETLNFKFVYNKWKSTRCKKTLNKQTKHNETKWQKNTFFTSVKNSLNFSGMPPLPPPPNGRVHGLGEEDLQTFQMPLWNVCICIDATTIPGNHYPPSLLQPTNYPTRPAAVLSCNYHSSCTNAVAAATKRKFCFVSGLVFGWPVNMSVQFHAKSLPVFTNSTNK